MLAHKLIWTRGFAQKTRPQTRRAWCFFAHGGPEVVRLETLDIPVLKDGQLLVKVVASSVNPMDWRLRTGLAAKVVYPRIP